MSNENCHTFPEQMKVNSINKQYETYEALSDHEEIILNTSQVKEVDTASLQLLTSFVKYSLGNGKKIHWQDVSELWLNQVRLLGLTDSINLTHK